MLPFLKNKLDGALGVGPMEVKERKPDDGKEPFSALDAVAEDMFEAFEKKDKSLFKSALEALCEYIKEEDIEQDEQSMKDQQ